MERSVDLAAGQADERGAGLLARVVRQRDDRVEARIDVRDPLEAGLDGLDGGDLTGPDPPGEVGRRNGPERLGYPSASMARTLSSRRRWRGSPLNVAPRKATMHSQAGSGPITREPRVRTFMSSCSTPWWAE
jgi:hypothetical protein